MKRFNISVNGHAYDVQVEEVAAGGATAAVPTAAPAAPAAPGARAGRRSPPRQPPLLRLRPPGRKPSTPPCPAPS